MDEEEWVKTARGMEAIDVWSLSSMLSALLVFQFQQLSLIKYLIYLSPQKNDQNYCFLDKIQDKLVIFFLIQITFYFLNDK